MTAAVGADADASVVSNTPPTPIVDAANTMSHTCNAAEANPRSFGAAYRSISTEIAGNANPIPAPVMTQSGIASHAGPQLGATNAIALSVTTSTPYPVRISTALGRSGCRPCHHDAPAQPSAPTVSGNPAIAADWWCTATNVSGTNASTPKNAPA